MLNFVHIDKNTIINISEIMYIKPQYDINCEIEGYNIVMKDKKYFSIHERKAEEIFFLLKDWMGSTSYAD